ncbi:hypothetical protein B566_EDAN011927 [Ephemera danica]|nr:hypothetical protein B566_EDAN011927 [Ephemera danica]
MSMQNLPCFMVSGTQLLSLLVPLLVACLREDSVTGARQRKSLHEYSLAWLMRVAPQYPQEFKLLMRQWPELRTRVQNAVRGSASNSTQQSTQQQTNAQQQRNENRTHQAPTIQLKTDFSNFAAS